MMKSCQWILLGVFAVVVSGCGNDILGTQENQREDMLPELQGNWTSLCEGKKVIHLSFSEKNLGVVEEQYYDPECTDPHRTISHTGAFHLAHNFKVGILNSVVYDSSASFNVTLHTDHEVDGQNTLLSEIQNEKEAVIKADATPLQRRQTTRSNLQIREAKKLEVWKRGEPKVLNRVQLEKLNSMNGALNETPIVDFQTRAAFRYELDNDYLQLKAPKIGERVYMKQK